MVSKYDLSEALAESAGIMESRRWQNGLKGAGRDAQVKRHFSKVADPITKQAMGVDSSNLVSKLPRPLIKWFTDLASQEVVSCPNVTEYKIIEVTVD